FTHRSVARDLKDRFPVTIELVVLALLVAFVVGVPAGAFAARRRGSTGDAAVRGMSFVFLALPDFWLGLILLYVFFFKLRLAPPPFGQLSPGDPVPRRITGAALFDSLITGDVRAIRPAASHAVLPVLTLGLVLAAPLARLSRSATIEVLNADYVR